MGNSIVIAERDNIAAVLDSNKKVCEFFIHKGDVLLNDVYLAKVDNILPSIDAAFVNVGSDKMGFLHASDIIGRGSLNEKLKPKQSIIVQVTKEPTGHKGPRVTSLVSLPGRFLVLLPDERTINVSRKITSPKERARLKSVVSLFKPASMGVIVRTEAENQSEAEIQEDLEILLEKWNTIITAADTIEAPNLLLRDQDLLYKVIREAATEETDEIIVDTPFAMHRAQQLLSHWNMGKNIKVAVYKGMEPLLVSSNIHKEIIAALQTKVNLPCGGYLFIQTTEALSVVDVNSGKFTSSATQDETILKTNLQAVDEIARQLKLRNIGGMIIVDFIDMNNRSDKLAVLEHFELALETDKAKPQIGQISDLGLVELTRHRQGQSLAEIFTKKCPTCHGSGLVVQEFNFTSSNALNDSKAKNAKLKLPGGQIRPRNNSRNNRPERTEAKPFNTEAEPIKMVENETRVENKPSKFRPKRGKFAPTNKIQPNEPVVAPKDETIGENIVAPVVEPVQQPVIKIEQKVVEKPLKKEPEILVHPIDALVSAAQIEEGSKPAPKKRGRKPSKKTKEVVKNEEQE